MKVIRVQNKSSRESSQRGWLGVSIDEVTRKLAQREDLKVTEGVYVRNVQEESPAEKAGIRQGDVIVEFDGRKVYDEDDLINEVRRSKPGTEVSLAVNRNGDSKILKATIERHREARTYSFNVPVPPRVHVAPRIFINRRAGMYGLTMEELNKQLGEYFGAPNGRGVLVKRVERESEGEKAGFKAGDVIVKVANDDVTDVDDIWHTLDGYKDGEKAAVEVLRKGAKQKLALTVEQRRLSERRLEWDGNDDDVIIDLPPDGDSHFHLEMDRLKRELKEMGRELRDNMIELKHRLKRDLKNVRVNVSI
jgi:serine protease Do